MSRSKSNTESVSLFPFLAVLVCAMGALIFLLIVTTRRIRHQAIAKVEAQREAELEAASAAQPKIVPVPLPIEEPVRTGLPPWPGTVILGNVQPTPFDVPLPQAEPEPPRELPPPPPIEWFIRRPDPPDPNISLREKLKELQGLRKAWQSEVARRADKSEQFVARRKQIDSEVEKLEKSLQVIEATASADAQLANELAARIERVRGQLAKTDQQIAATRRVAANSPTKFAITPFDGRTGTNMRPVLIELTGQGVRFVPENVALTPEQFEGYTNEVNPLLAGTKALLEYWSELSRRSGGAEPEPYVMLIVRPSGAEFFNARNLLAALERPIGYELLEENLPLDLPEPDPVAAETCRRAIANLMSERRQLRQLLVDRGLSGTGTGAGNEGDAGAARNLLSGVSPDDFGEEAGNVRRLPAGMRENGTARDKADTFAAIASDRTRREAGGPPASGMGRVGQPNHPFTNGSNGQSAEDNRSGGQQPSQSVGQKEGGGTHVPPAPTKDSQEPRRLFAEGGDVGDELGQFGEINFGTPGRSNPNAMSENSGTQSQDANRGEQPNGEPGKSEAANSSGNPVATSPTRRPSGTPNGTGTPGSPSTNRGQGEAILPDFATLYMRNKLRKTEPRPHRWGYSDPRATIGFERAVRIEVYPDHLIVGDAFLVRTAKAETADQISVWMLEAIERTARSWSYPPTKFYWNPTLDFRVAPGAEKLYGHLDQTAIEWGLQREASRLETTTEGQP
ncbi:hypothetical protein [Thalassoroseus pseudoceratinae]|uniref:hypothetical protein n=1 Tax=Thalassoroseus pseudoceratinae TaxID=2713176 RepID=UPI00141F9CB9|nr:hypothetical protein [Thalassoroseus pseudoceratinae]